MAGEETVLLFVRDPVASISRPVLELKGVAKAALAAGSETTVRMTLTCADLAFVGTDLESRLEPGEFEIFVGSSASTNTLLKASVRLVAN